MKPLSTIRKAADALAIKYAAAVQHADAESLGVTTAQTEYRDALEARRIGQEIARKTQTQAARPIIDIVGRCLEAVFPDHYTFDVRFELRRGKTEVDLVFVKNGYDVDPIGASGGGVVDVAAFALRLAVMMLSTPRVQRILVLDEPFKNIQAPRWPRLRSLIQQLVDEMGLQIIQTTPVPALALGNVIEIGD